MEDFKTPDNSIEKREKGMNCSIKIKFLRHAHKEEFDPHKEGKISDSKISEKGKLSSRILGNEETYHEIIKPYIGSLDRHDETADALGGGIEEQNVDHQILRKKKVNDLDPPHFSANFIKEYRSHFKSLPNNFDSLNEDEREKLIEDAEAPAVEYWLNLWDKKFDKETESAEEVAERVSNRLMWFDKMIKKLNSGSKIELLNVTSRTVIEPILIKCLKPPIKNLEEIGGPINLLEDFNLEIKTDNNGNKGYKISFRNNAYEIDWKMVEKLAETYKQRRN